MGERALTNKAASGGRAPAHQIVYRALRDRILHGEMAPGQPVTIQGLADSTGAGMTPVREAIRRLTSEGALVFQDNRRVSVPVLDARGAEELIFARQALEPELARRAAATAGPDALARLAAEDAALDRAIARGDVGGYLRHNHGFHAVLYVVARAPVLADLVEGLWLRFGPSLRIVCGRVGTGSLPDRHKEIMDALAAGDGDAAAAAMREDIEQGMAALRAGIAAGEG
ncbi:GntR family transcriptional regulator [Rhodosalinus sp. K401]|uniref:GntR family transcriptional regulator n=1 Tax=Rhodosalinus sp. K401 TaxID=3239195 RepID=UPI0035248A91